MTCRCPRHDGLNRHAGQWSSVTPERGTNSASAGLVDMSVRRHIEWQALMTSPNESCTHGLCECSRARYETLVHTLGQPRHRCSTMPTTQTSNGKLPDAKQMHNVALRSMEAHDRCFVLRTLQQGKRKYRWTLRIPLTFILTLWTVRKQKHDGASSTRKGPRSVMLTSQQRRPRRVVHAAATELHNHQLQHIAQKT